MKLYFKNFEIYHNISIYLFYFPGAAAEPLGSARGALMALRSTGWEPLLYSNEYLCVTSGFRCGLSEICALRGVHTFRHKYRSHRRRSGRLLQSLYPRERDRLPIVQEAGWAPVPVWTGEENLIPTGIRSSDRPALSESLYRLRYPCPTNV